VIEPLLAALLAAALGAVLHFAIGRAARRLPRWLAQQRSDAIGPDVRHGRAFALGAVVLRSALWLALAWGVSERFEPLMQARGWSLMLLAKALGAPLFTVGERAYSALDVLPLPVLLVALWLVVGLCVRAVRSRLLEAVGVESGLQETLAILLRYSLTFVGAIVLL